MIRKRWCASSSLTHAWTLTRETRCVRLPYLFVDAAAPARYNPVNPLQSGATPLHAAALQHGTPVIPALLDDPRVDVNARDEASVI